MKLTITIEGDTESDLAIALELITSQVEEGYLSGADSNETGSYSYNVE